MFATPINDPEKIAYKSKETGEELYFYKQTIALHDTEKCPDALVLIAKRAVYDFGVAEDSHYTVGKTYIVSSSSFRQDQRGRPAFGRLNLAEVK